MLLLWGKRDHVEFSSRYSVTPRNRNSHYSKRACDLPSSNGSGIRERKSAEEEALSFFPAFLPLLR